MPAFTTFKDGGFFSNKKRNEVLLVIGSSEQLLKMFQKRLVEYRMLHSNSFHCLIVSHKVRAVQ